MEKTKKTSGNEPVVNYADYFKAKAGKKLRKYLQVGENFLEKTHRLKYNIIGVKMDTYSDYVWL